MMSDTPGKRPPWYEHTARRVQLGCRQTFAVYQGQGGRMMMNPLQFLHEAGLTERNLLIIRDPTRNYYQRGLGPDVPDVRSMISWHQHLLGTLPHAPELYCIGSSAGAYAAILCGHLLKARAVYAFAPPTDLTDLLEQDKIDCPDRTYVDLRPLLESSNGVTRYHVYYNESSTADREAAQRLRDCPGVELHAEQGEGHGVIVHLVKMGKLKGLMPEFVAAG
jgi:hypothetical protein